MKEHVSPIDGLNYHVTGSLDGGRCVDFAEESRGNSFGSCYNQHFELKSVHLEFKFSSENENNLEMDL